MLVVHIVTGIVIGATLFASIFYMGYKAGSRDYEEALTIATLIERYKVLKNTLAEIESVTKPKPEPTTKSTNKTKTKTGRKEL